MTRVLGVVVPVSYSDTIYRMRQLWFLDICMCLGGWYSLGRSKSLSIGPSQRTWLDTFPGTSWFYLHCLHPHKLYLILCGLLRCTFPLKLLRWPLHIVCSTPPYAHLFLVSGIIWLSLPWLTNNNHLMYGQFQMYTSWPWWTAKVNCMSDHWWYIMFLLPNFYEVLVSTVPKLPRRSWLCFAVGLTFFENFVDIFSLDHYHDRVFLVFCWHWCGSWCV